MRQNEQKRDRDSDRHTDRQTTNSLQSDLGQRISTKCWPAMPSLPSNSCSFSTAFQPLIFIETSASNNQVILMTSINLCSGTDFLLPQRKEPLSQGKVTVLCVCPLGQDSDPSHPCHVLQPHKTNCEALSVVFKVAPNPRSSEAVIPSIAVPGLGHCYGFCSSSLGFPFLCTEDES